MPMKPSAPMAERISSGTLFFSSISCAIGSTFSRAKSRAVRCTISCSGVSARSNPVAGSVLVVVAMVVLQGEDADVPAIRVAREEVVAVEVADDVAGALGTVECRDDVSDAEPHDEAALSADLGRRLAVGRLIQCHLRVLRVEPRLRRVVLAGEPCDLAVEARDVAALRAERHHRPDGRRVLLRHAFTGGAE